MRWRMGPPNQPLHPDALPFGRLWYDGPNAASDAIGYPASIAAHMVL